MTYDVVPTQICIFSQMVHVHMIQMYHIHVVCTCVHVWYDHVVISTTKIIAHERPRQTSACTLHHSTETMGVEKEAAWLRPGSVHSTPAL